MGKRTLPQNLRQEPTATLRGLLDLLFPPHCVACGERGAWLCDRCLQRVPWLQEPLCPHCGRPQSHDGLCSRCAETHSALEAIRSVSLHVWPLRPAVHALKYEGLRVLAPTLGELLANCWSQGRFAAELVLPVPLHVRRERRRGYNQSALLARSLAAQLGLPLSQGELRRRRDTRSQVGLSAQQRQENVRDAFVWEGAPLAGAGVLLVDDVLTTGSTLEACAGALRRGGAGGVVALTLTRALEPGDDLPDGRVPYHAFGAR